MSNPFSAREAFGPAMGLFVAMVFLTAPLVPALPAIQLTFNREAFAAVYAAWVARAEAWRFTQHFWLDVPFVFAYAWAGWRWRERQPLAGLLLVGAALADLLEDALHLWFLGWPGSAPDEFYFVAGWAAMVKFKLWVVAGAVAVVRWHRRRQRDV